MVAIVVYVHQVIQEVAVKFAMHVKVTPARMGEPVNLSIAMLDINVYVHQALVANDVKIVCILLHVFMRS
jgi:hypothetical protein